MNLTDLITKTNYNYFKDGIHVSAGFYNQLVQSVCFFSTATKALTAGAPTVVYSALDFNTPIIRAPKGISIFNSSGVNVSSDYPLSWSVNGLTWDITVDSTSLGSTITVTINVIW